MNELIIIGGGLAGSEAVWQAAIRGIKVTLFEMRPLKLTEAHKTGFLGELVCSNSLRSGDIMSAPGLLKKELETAGSLIMKAAEVSRVPAGGALAVDRAVFSGFLTDAISRNPNIEVVREEVKEIPHAPCIIATGPLTSSPMADALGRITGNEYLYFYDAISPIVDAGSIDYDRVYFASRYGKGGDDYVNCPMTREEYEKFFDALLEADKVSARAFESEKVFEGCMPVEVMASRGKDTLRFGPMKPVGLRDPKTGRDPYAVVQLRPENRDGSAYNMVGFQTRIKWPEQQRVFRMIPGLEKAEFLRFGSVHRNTFINSPLFLREDLTLKAKEEIYLAGQITGVEGYIESTAMGLVAGINAARRILGREAVAVPDTTAHGSLIRHITTPAKNFQPSNINFGLFPPVNSGRGKDLRKKTLVERAVKNWEEYIERVQQ
ncbi:MAG: methylenetetrahydrofolate--tRNA-(uracil(54)-C(5))-methyltransferase (FADH(2)-oxidizing) TrmFO [Nitrospirae bacterium]|nr:methylenetetrahydrofolate--tRNA-(uracil(54)-C(5))-methyltransferase (FADH(2)-oxidizing) TrmFO [Nitrospirota bacterium]